MQPDPAPAPPPALRSSATRWRDPRLVVGILVIAGSVLLGSWAVGDSEERVAVWALVTARPAGFRLEPGDLVARQVWLAGGSAERYLPTSTGVVGQTLVRPVGAGELLPAAAVAADADPGQVQLPLPAEAVVLPPKLQPGAVVDLWAVPEKSTGGSRARRLLHDATVIAVPGSRDPLAPAGPDAVLIAVSEVEGNETLLGEVIAATTRGPVVLTVRGAR